MQELEKATMEWELSKVPKEMLEKELAKREEKKQNSVFYNMGIIQIEEATGTTFSAQGFRDESGNIVDKKELYERATQGW